jgi:predicted kinase
MIKLRHIILEQSTNPKALILAGSPGAGKSSFIEGVKDAIILNVDDYYMRNLKDLNVSLDLRNANAEDRSKAAQAMAAANKEFRPMTREIILGKKNFILDGTAASSGPTLKLKAELEELGYDVLMVYVFASLEKALDRNDTRFDRSGGKDRSLAPAIVLRTWNNITQNYELYQKEFRNNFVSVVNDKALEKGEPMSSLESLVDKYITPYSPKDTKPKTDKEKAKSAASKAELEKQINDFVNSNKIEDIKASSVSKDEAKSRVNQFFS